jgi:hypothetical protein
MRNELTRRDLLKSTFGAAAAAGLAQHASALLAAGEKESATVVQQASGGPLPWYCRLLVGIEWGPTGANDKDKIYLAQATGKQIIESLARARAEYAVVFMKDMSFAYYNSRIVRKCPNLGDRDLLRECCDEAAKHNMPVVAYCQIQYDTATGTTHPDWWMRDPQGKEIWGRLCYNSPYLDHCKQVAAEMMEYPIAGFHFDMLDFGFTADQPIGCWCDRCQAAFKKEYGIAMPKGVTWDAAWDKMLEFRCNSNTRFCEKLQAFVKSKRPEVSVDFNYHGYPPFNWIPGERPVQHAMNGDFVTAEGLPWIFGDDNPSLLSLFMAGARADGRIQGVTSRSVYNYHDFTVRTVPAMKWEVFTYLAHGAQCTIVEKANYDGTLDPVVFERIGEVFGEARQKREYFGHKPVQEVGLYYSARTRDWYARQDPPKYMAAFWGAHRALIQSHIPLGMIMDESVSTDRLRQFPVVYLPNAAILTRRETALLDEYVAGGGNLLVTGLTGVCNQYGEIQKESEIASLIGARLVRCQTEFPDNYVRLPGKLGEGEGKFLLQDIPADWPMLTYGPIAVYEPAGARAFGELMLAYRSQDNMWSRHMSPEKVVGPAVLVHQHGKGKVVYVPCVPDAAWVGDYRMPEHRKLIRNIIRWLNPRPEVLVQAPVNVEAMVMRDEAKKRLLVHFVCFCGSTSNAPYAFPNGRRVLPPMMEESPQYKATVRVNRPFAKAEVVGPNTNVTVRENMIDLTTANAHELLILRL